MAYTDEVLADSPYTYWRLGEAAGSSTIADSSGNSRSGSVASPTGSGLASSSVLPNQPGNTAYLVASPGATPYAFGGQALAPFLSGTSYSVEMWLNVPTAITTTTYFLERNIQIGFTSTASNQLRFIAPYNTSSALLTSAGAQTAIPVNQPVHIVGTASLSGSTLTTRLYINGIQVQTAMVGSVTSLVGNVDSNINIPLTIGARSTGNLASSTSSRASGVTIDEVALYQSALSAQRIADHYNAGIASPNVAPSNSAAPSLSGTAKVGQTLTTTDGTWTGTPTPTYTYQWKSASTSGGSYSNISGATSSTYTLTSDEAGKYIKAEVTATNSEGAVAALSSASAQVVQDVANTGAPTISTVDDVLQVGSEMTSTDGTWDGFPAPTYAYQWQVSEDGDNSWTNISGATSSSYTLTSAQGGKYVRLQVTATNSEGSEIAYSTASAYIAEDPVSVVAPTVSGQAVIEETLQADPGTWTGFPSPNFTYQWQRSADGSTNWQTISGATSSTYTLGEVDVEKYIRVTVQGSNNAGEAVASSAPLGPVEGGGSATAAVVGALVSSGAL